MSGYPESMQVLIEELSRMPGIGRRTAERLAFYVLGAGKDSMVRLASSIRKVNDSIRYCKRCFNLSERDECSICIDATRDRSMICVVEQPKDIMTIEKSHVYRGLYHVLLGVLSPLDGVGPRDIKIQELIDRVKEDDIKEVVLATTPDTEGEATAIYLAKSLKSSYVKVTRLAQGLPVGGNLEFVDKATMMHAIEARNQISA